jgi:UDP-N-acetylmuramate--alanine ligase
MGTHFIGIGGIGMSALAHWMLDQPEASAISGCDKGHGPLLDQLRARGAMIDADGASDLPNDCSQVIYSTAIPSDHPQMQAARARGLPLLHRSELLANIMQGQLPLLVAGTHGKTTTAALLGWILFAAGWDPSLALGGVYQSGAHSSPRHGHRGQGLYFVAEADESDGTFLRYCGFGTIVTNCDRDHLDHFLTEGALLEAFRLFCRGQDHKSLFWCRDDRALSSLQLPGQSYGFSQEADWVCCDVEQTSQGLYFSVQSRQKRLERLQLPLWGRHNALNATAVVALAQHLGLSDTQIREGMASFPGVGRRCQLECQSPFVVLHDYGHHPTEIAATLQGLRERYRDKRLIVAFQPHRFTRTRDLLEEFGPSMDRADLIVSTDIYAASEPALPGVDGPALVEAMQRTLAQQGSRVDPCYVPRQNLHHVLNQILRPNDVLVCFGAGDIDAVAKQVALMAQSAPPWVDPQVGVNGL